MPIALRKSDHRGKVDFGWLDSRHTFSFGHYHDPAHMGFGPLRVINEDRVAPEGGFPTHPHADMEILSYVLSGALEHKDSIGTGSVIKPGDVQRMSAGSGVRHSEFNASKTESVHFLQIWILPERRGIAPSYEQKAFADEEKLNRLRLIASRDARQGSIRIHRDVDLYAALIGKGHRVEHAFAPKRLGWVQVTRGSVDLDGDRLDAGDGAAIKDMASIKLTGIEDAEVLLFDMAQD